MKGPLREAPQTKLSGIVAPRYARSLIHLPQEFGILFGLLRQLFWPTSWTSTLDLSADLALEGKTWHPWCCLQVAQWFAEWPPVCASYG